MAEKSVILHEEITLSQADTESVVGSARDSFCHFHQPPCAPEETIVVEMGEESLGGVPEQPVVGDHGETDEDAGREADIQGDDANVVCGANALAISGFEPQGFIFSEIVPENDWRDRLCLRVLLTPLDLRNVCFQIFKIYQ